MNENNVRLYELEVLKYLTDKSTPGKIDASERQLLEQAKKQLEISDLIAKQIEERLLQSAQKFKEVSLGIFQKISNITDNIFFMQIYGILFEERKVFLLSLKQLPNMSLDDIRKIDSTYFLHLVYILIIRKMQTIKTILKIKEEDFILNLSFEFQSIQKERLEIVRLLRKIVKSYIAFSINSAFLDRIKERSTKEIKPLVNMILTLGSDEQRKILKGYLESNDFIYQNLILEAILEEMTSTYLTQPIEYQVLSYISYNIFDRGIEFIQKEKSFSIFEILDIKQIDHAVEMYDLIDDILCKSYQNSYLLELIRRYSSYSYIAKAPINTIGMVYGDSPQIYYGGKFEGYVVIDVNTNEGTRWNINVKSPVRTLSVSKSGKYLVTGHETGEIVLIGTEDHTILFSKTKLIDNLRKIIFSNDEKWIIFGGNDKENAIKVMNRETGEIKLLKGHSSYINDLAITQDDKVLYSVSQDKSIIKWDLVNLKLAAKGTTTSTLKSICLSKDEKIIYTGDNRPEATAKNSFCRILKWDVDALDKGAQIVISNAHTNTIRNLILSESEKYIFSSSLDSQLKIWKIENSHLCADFFNPDEKQNRAFFLSPDARYCITGDTGGSVRFWNLDYLLNKELEKTVDTQMRKLDYYHVRVKDVNSLSIEKILGDYQLNNNIVRVYPKMIELIARDLATKVENKITAEKLNSSMNILTKLHEIGHAISIRGNEDNSKNAVHWAIGFHEAMAQYFTFIAINYDPFGMLSNLRLSEVFTMLANNQSMLYNIYKYLPASKESIPKVIGFFEKQKTKYKDNKKSENKSIITFTFQILDKLNTSLEKKELKAIKADSFQLYIQKYKAFTETIKAENKIIRIAKQCYSFLKEMTSNTNLFAFVNEILESKLTLTESEIDFMMSETVFFQPDKELDFLYVDINSLQESFDKTLNSGEMDIKNKAIIRIKYLDEIKVKLEKLKSSKDENLDEIPM